jgi:hypothetical protein
LAWTTTVPAPVIVNVLPEIVAGPEMTVYVIVWPDESVAASVMGVAPYAVLATVGKVIVCEASVAVKVSVTEVAAA